MKRILSAALCLVLMLGTAQAAEYFYINRSGSPYYHADKDCPSMNKGIFTWVESYTISEIPYDVAACPVCTAPEIYYYVNPDGGRFYHSDDQCPSMSSKYWGNLVTVTEDMLLREPYEGLAPCNFCVGLPAEDEDFSDPWISRFDTAKDVYLTDPGVYVAGIDIAPGLYTVRTTDQTQHNVVTALIDGTVVNTFGLHEEASYSFYLWDGMSVTLPEHAVLTPIVKRSESQAVPEQETIRLARRMLYYEVPTGVYAAEAIDGQEGFIIFSPIMADAAQDEPTVFSLAGGETIVFDTCLDGTNDPMPIQYFASPSGKAYFVEFINCVVRPVDVKAR